MAVTYIKDLDATRPDGAVDQRFYTYIYFDPTNDMEPFYVGKGCGDRHVCHLKRTHNKHLRNRINKIRREYGDPWIAFEFMPSEQDALDYETALIARFGRRDLGTGTLCNLTDGGEGSANLSPDISRQKAEKLSVFAKSRTGDKNPSFGKTGENSPLFGRNHSIETKQKISESRTGNTHSEETRQKLRDAKSGIRQPIVTCPHCGKTGGSTSMKPHHFDNCKFKESNDD